jgi:hypothetical protein
MLFPLAALLACASGTTMRVAEDDGGGDQPVSLSPTPDTGPAEQPGDTLLRAAAPEQRPDTLPDETNQEKAYSAYGATGALEIRRIGQWTRTGIGEARRLVIRNANAWADFWAELGVGDRPEVDFTRDIVVAVAAGQRPTGGHEIAVQQVSRDNAALTVEVLETSPGPNCTTSTSQTQPVDVVVIPAVSSKSLSFVERKEVRGCR